MEDISSSMSERIRTFLQNDPVAKSIEFPCLSHLLRRNWVYRPSDYYTVSELFGVGKVQIYIDPEVDAGSYFNAADGKTGDFLLLAPTVANNLQQWLSVVVHECTHMVQDYKKMRLTRQEFEMDAHFAQALYRVRSANKADKAAGEALTYFDIAAKEYDDDPDYLPSMAFRKYRHKLRSCLNSGYGHAEDYTKKKRLDGVIL